MDLDWVFGFSKDIKNGVHSLCVDNRNAIFLVSSHSGVIYDFEKRTQTLLQGHCNVISCSVVDKEKKWIVTTDIGEESIMIVWDANTFVPVKTYILPHDRGVSSLDMSDDGLYLATLSAVDEASGIQEIAIWAWTTDEPDAIIRQRIDSVDLHYSVKFNPADNFQLLTTSKASVTFWSWGEFSLEAYTATASKKDVGPYHGHFATSIFLAGTENAITATSEGFVIVWEADISAKKTEEHKCVKVPTKVLHLVSSGINYLMTTTNKYIVAACADGAVRFYDYYLRMEAWFEDLNAGPLTSISFSIQDNPMPGEVGAPGLKFWVPDFIVGTSDSFVVGVESAVFEEVRKEDRQGTLLMQGMTEKVVGVACHPSQPLVALVCSNGALQLWNYEMKLLMVLREFSSVEDGKKEKSHMRPNCIAFDSTGLLGVGFASGIIKLLHAETLEDIIHFTPTSDSIQTIQFSKSGGYLGAVDSSNHVLIFRREVPKDPRTNKPIEGASEELAYLGRSLSHTAKITGIEFGYKDIYETLVSVSEDRHVVEYDLSQCSISNGIVCIKTKDDVGAWHSSLRLEVASKPTAIMWHPRSLTDSEDRFIIANDEFKLKEYNVQSKQCRKTTLAPRFGTPPVKMLELPQPGGDQPNDDQKYYVFATSERVIGIGAVPLIGSPADTMGVIAHPGAITSIAVSYDGQYLFSAGGTDLSTNMWRVTVPEYQREMSAVDIAPFFALLEGGEGGELHSDIIDYFYYCQLRQIGEDTMEQRELVNKITLEDIPAIMRAVGFYPSEEECQNMINEVQYKTFAITGQTIEDVTLEEFLRLYLNHRPVVPLEHMQINKAFETLAGNGQGSNPGESALLTWETLKNYLTGHGEIINPADLDAYITALTGENSAAISDDALLDGNAFAGDILGFEEL